jgi:hypothetical protein
VISTRAPPRGDREIDTEPACPVGVLAEVTQHSPQRVGVRVHDIDGETLARLPEMVGTRIRGFVV